MESIEYGKAVAEAGCQIRHKERFEKIWTLGVSTEQIPHIKSGISLSKEKDFFGQRKISMNWPGISEIERATVRKIVENLGIELGRLSMGRLQISDSLQSGEVFNVKDAINHHMGTTRMSDSPQTGVVDKNCKVFGVDNLYIAGNSVFASSGAVNPTFSSMALGLRLVDHLA